MSLSSLCSAVVDGDQQGVKRALQDGEDPNSSMPWNIPEAWVQLKRVPVLLVAVSERYSDVVSVLLDAKGINPDLRGDFRGTPLYLASVRGSTDIVENLLNGGSDINKRDSIGGSLPIHAAAYNNHVQIMRLLKTQGSDLNSVTNNGNTPLLTAAYYDCKAAVSWLLEQDVNVNYLNNSGQTALDRAESKSHMEVVRILKTWEKNLAARVQNQLKINEEPIVSASQEPQSGKRLYILNYIKFPSKNNTEEQTKNREGASFDSQNLTSTFRSRGYDVLLHENKTADQTNIILDYIQQDTNSKFLLLIILSHGRDSDTFITSDGRDYSLKSIQQRFTDSECPQLKGQTKIIMSNFCRGTNIEDLIPTPAYKHKDYNERDAVVCIKEPPHNMIIIHASHEGFAAMRDTRKGTAFVQNLCEVLKEQASQPIQDTFNDIFERIRENGGQTPEMKVSAPFAKFSF